jgi:hypothetical protein
MIGLIAYLFKEANEGGRICHHPDTQAQDNNGKNLGKVVQVKFCWKH